MFLGAGVMLLNLELEIAVETTAPWQLTSAGGDGDPGDSWLMVSVQQSGGATSPALSVAVQYSLDGEEWVTHLSLTTSSGSPSAVSSAAAPIGRYMRVLVVPSGGTAPACNVQALLLAKAQVSGTLLS